MASQRVINFGAGPAALPESVLVQAQRELLNYKDSGRSVMELSHRSKLFEELNQKAEDDLRKLLNIPNNYKVIFLQGGGTGQFSAVPLNLLGDKSVADYLITGVWSKKAYQEAQKYCNPHAVVNMEKSNFTSVSTEWNFSDESNSAYTYYCDNETVNGVEFHSIPAVSGSRVLVADMSSNFLTKTVDVSKYGLIYAGAQKNSGISGLTVVIVRDDLLNRSKKITPTVFEYKINSENKSLYNTPPTFSIYMAGLVFEWVLAQGGVEAMQQMSETKSKLIYDVIDSSNFYRCPVEHDWRSRVNIPFRLRDEKLESLFVQEAAKRNMVELAGHRSVGGIRASLYNAITVKETETLRDFMKEFAVKHQQ